MLFQSEMCLFRPNKCRFSPNKCPFSPKSCLFRPKSALSVKKVPFFSLLLSALLEIFIFLLSPFFFILFFFSFFLARVKKGIFCTRSAPAAQGQWVHCTRLHPPFRHPCTNPAQASMTLEYRNASQNLHPPTSY